MLNNQGNIWAIGDLHLSFGVSNKAMDIFGEDWVDWTDKIENNWKGLIKPDDLVLIPGDISWAMYPEEAASDLEWIHQLPGTKVLIRGNHDYWWSSKSKVEKILPPSLHILQNNAFHWNQVSIAGARLWDTPEISFDQFSNIEIEAEPDIENMEKIYTRELGRLEMSLKEMKQDANIRIVMTHYPPIGAELLETRASSLLEKYHVNICVFGHLHNFKPGSLPFGTKNGVKYLLSSCDYLEFTPIRIL